IRLLPDPETFALLPYQPKTARLYCDLYEQDRTPWGACPRSFLKRMVDRAREAGFTVKAAFENEFTLALRREGGLEPYDRSLCFSSAGMDSTAPVIQDVVESLEGQGVSVEEFYPELGPGQQELPIRFADALPAADNQLTVRETARGVAHNHGLIASFSPKPFPGEAGNGCHLHFSLWDRAGRKNLFHDRKDRYGLSQLGYHFMGGILRHLPALVALTAPSFQSYSRLVPHFWSSAFTAWGPDNREAAVRVVSPLWGREMESANLELKPCDPSNNPYIALGGLIAAGLDGIKHETPVGEPSLSDPGLFSEEERARLGIRRLPTSIREATDELERDKVLGDAIGEVLLKDYLLIKRHEWEYFSANPPEHAFERHFAIF
ncbi:MAG: glutamine synthetase family protein, partial [Nitrospinota bacterium]